MKYLRHTQNNKYKILCHTGQNLTRDNNKRHWILVENRKGLSKEKEKEKGR
jgi:hypothetical protein